MSIVMSVSPHLYRASGVTVAGDRSGLGSGGGVYGDEDLNFLFLGSGGGSGGNAKDLTINPVGTVLRDGRVCAHRIVFVRLSYNLNVVQTLNGTWLLLIYSRAVDVKIMVQQLHVAVGRRHGVGDDVLCRFVT